MAEVFPQGDALTTAYIMQFDLQLKSQDLFLLIEKNIRPLWQVKG